MPSNPPLVSDLEAEVGEHCGVVLAEAGVYFRALDADNNPITPAIRKGLRRGAKCVGLFLSNPLVLTDADVANLSPFAMERVLDEAKLFALQEALLNWHRALQKYAEAPLSQAPTQGGWLMDERRAVKERVAALKAACSEPYREPADPVVVANGYPDVRPGWSWWTGGYPYVRCGDIDGLGRGGDL